MDVLSVMAQSLLLSSNLASGIIENPVVRSIGFDSPEAICFQKEIRKQAPEGVLGAGDIHVMGPSVVRFMPPIGSVLELFVAAPNAKTMPRFLSLSLRLETPDRTVWEQSSEPDGTVVYKAAQVANPAMVFDRIGQRFLFELDLTPCLKKN